MKLWTADFKTTNSIKMAPVWIRISDPPMSLYQEKVLMKLAEGLGKPIRVDHRTTYTNRANFVRVSVEIDLEQPLKGTVSVNVDRFLIEYEGLSAICFGCGMVGHLKSHCHATKPLPKDPN